MKYEFRSCYGTITSHAIIYRDICVAPDATELHKGKNPHDKNTIYQTNPQSVGSSNSDDAYFRN
jgi:hypothetical protein